MYGTTIRYSVIPIEITHRATLGSGITESEDLSYPETVESVCIAPDRVGQLADKETRIRQVLSAEIDPKLRL